MKFDPEGALSRGVCEVWGAVFFIEIVFVAAVVVEADMVAVMTGEAAVVVRLSAKHMTVELAVLVGKMTGRTADPVRDSGEIVAAAVHMASQAAAYEKVLDQL